MKIRELKEGDRFIWEGMRYKVVFDDEDRFLCKSKVTGFHYWYYKNSEEDVEPVAVKQKRKWVPFNTLQYGDCYQYDFSDTIFQKINVPNVLLATEYKGKYCAVSLKDFSVGYVHPIDVLVKPVKKSSK